MIPMSLSVLAAMMMVKRDYFDLFGPVPDGVEPAVFIKSGYRHFQKALHPDRFQDDDAKLLATEAFTYLGVLHEQAKQAIRLGQYGKPLQLAIVHTRKGEHRIVSQAGVGDLSTTYFAQSKKGSTTEETFCKIVNDPHNGDLLTKEAKALKILNGPNADPEWLPYVPQLIETFIYAEPGKPRRQANVLNRLEGFYSLEEIRQRFPDGLSPLHAVWMWRRLLMVLGFAHDLGVVHGAVLPRHVMILPEEHGLTLVDWSYASIREDHDYQPLVAIVNDYRDWYPEEVMAKQAASPATDIALAARTMIWLMGGDPVTGNLPLTVPYQLRAFFKGCLLQSQSMRPQNAWLLFKEFDELLEDIGGEYFPRRFREFVLA
jgi:hypothetical protein